VAGVLILIGIAGISRLQIRSVPDGWRMSFGREDIDITTLKEDILRAAEQRNREANVALIREMRAEIARSGAEFTQARQATLAAALSRLDSRFKKKELASGARRPG